MQSFLQYRRCRKQLEQQIQRHGLERVTSHTRPTDPRECKEGLQPDLEGGPTEARDHVLEEKEVENDISRGPSQQAVEEDHNTGKLEKLDLPVNNEEGNTIEPTGWARSKCHSDPEKGSQNTPFYNAATQAEPVSRQDVTPTCKEDPSGSTLQETASLDTVSIASREDIRTTSTRRSGGQGFGRILTGINVRSRQSHEGDRTKGQVFIVGFQGDHDPLNPHNWSIARKSMVTALVALIGLIVGFASSVDSAALDEAAKELHVSKITESLATGIYLIGFGFGAFFAAPISETVGRNPVYVATLFLFMMFIMASALAPNIGAQIVFRFLAGFFGSTPLTCAGGSISDMWTAKERTAVFPAFANSSFWGPLLGPVIGGFIGQSYLSWRWCEWITLIWAGLIFGLMFFFMPETYAPILLKWKAGHLRNITGDDRYMSSLEVQDTKFWERLIHNMYRPFVMFVSEPIAILFTLYLTIVYIVLFTFLTGFEFIFLETYGLPQGLTFLIFVALGIGFIIASIIVPFLYISYKRRLQSLESSDPNTPACLPPERRLVFAMISAPCLPIGLFWMGWSATPSVSVWSPIIACIPVGFAIIGIFISTYQYLIDAFETYAASALVGATFIRYVVSGCMVVVSIPFYEGLGVHWTLTTLGVISALMVPVPFVFWKYGARIRARSRHATSFKG